MQEKAHTLTKVLTEENTYEKRHSARNMHAMVNAFNAEDEEGEVFDNIYLGKKVTFLEMIIILLNCI